MSDTQSQPPRPTPGTAPDQVPGGLGAACRAICRHPLYWFLLAVPVAVGLELASDGGLLPVNRAPMFIASNPDPGWQGEQFWTADNPPAGATFHYYLKETLRTREQERQRADRAAQQRGEDVFYPPWDSLRLQDMEEAPQMILTVADSDGRVVRRLTGGTAAGITSVTWDLRYPSASPIRAGGGGGGGFGGGFGGGGGGPYVVPGTYTVSLAKHVRDTTEPLGMTQTFEVYPLDDVTNPRSPDVLAFQQQTAALQRAVLGANAAAGEAMRRIGLLERALHETPDMDPQLGTDLRAVEDSIRAVLWALTGDPTVRRRREATPPSLTQRVGRITGQAFSRALHEVTGLQREQYDIVAAEFGGILDRLRRHVDVEMKQIEDRAEAAGAPWTSGRIPTWRP